MWYGANGEVDHVNDSDSEHAGCAGSVTAMHLSRKKCMISSWRTRYDFTTVYCRDYHSVTNQATRVNDVRHARRHERAMALMEDRSDLISISPNGGMGVVILAQHCCIDIVMRYIFAAGQSPGQPVDSVDRTGAALIGGQ